MFNYSAQMTASQLLDKLVHRVVIVNHAISQNRYKIVPTLLQNVNMLNGCYFR